MYPFANKIFLLLLLFLFLISCREEVIAPDTFVENVNDPVQIRDYNSFIFLLNADNFTMDLEVPSIFTSIRTRFSIKLIDYEDGYAKVTAQDNNSNQRFNYFAADEVIYDSELLDGYVPQNIVIHTSNFTGKLKIEFRKTL
jgi:hypothetical protein